MKLIRSIIGLVATVILIALSVSISVVIKLLGVLGVDISDRFKCHTKINTTEDILAAQIIRAEVDKCAAIIYQNPERPELTRAQYLAVANFITGGKVR